MRLPAAAALLLLAGPLAGQADTTRQDTTGRAARDTTPPDTGAVLLPVFPAATLAGPLPPGQRWVFTIDSVLLSGARTLSDLIARVPGVHVARGGFYGQAEPVFYQGRAARGLEVYWDGLPYLPLGRDSVFLDPARIALAPLERVEIVVEAATLRVYLTSLRPASTVPATEIGILTGQLDIARYRGGFAKRWRSGLGLTFMAEWPSLDGRRGTSTTTFSGEDLWLKVDYQPSARVGASFAFLSSKWTRDSAPGLVERAKVERRDRLFRSFVAARADGLGPRVELAALSTSADAGDTLVGTRASRQERLAVSNRWRRAHVALSAAREHERLPLVIEASGSWVPTRGVTLAAKARRTRYRGERTGERAHLAAGVELPLGFAARGEIAWSREPAAAFVSTAVPQEATDLDAALRWDHALATVELGTGERDAFAPVAAPEDLKPLSALGPSFRTRYARAHGNLRILPGLSLSGWYFHPIGGTAADFEPPRHGRSSVTFQSKFWRVFRSGVFTLRGEVAIESWSGGRGGLGASVQPLVLPGATFVETNLEMRIAGVTLVWVLQNANLMRAGYAPGLSYPRAIQYYGARWAFTN